MSLGYPKLVAEDAYRFLFDTDAVMSSFITGADLGLKDLPWYAQRASFVHTPGNSLL